MSRAKYRKISHHKILLWLLMGCTMKSSGIEQRHIVRTLQVLNKGILHIMHFHPLSIYKGQSKNKLLRQIESIDDFIFGDGYCSGILSSAFHFNEAEVACFAAKTFNVVANLFFAAVFCCIGRYHQYATNHHRWLR